MLHPQVKDGLGDGAEDDPHPQGEVGPGRLAARPLHTPPPAQGAGQAVVRPARLHQVAQRVVGEGEHNDNQADRQVENLKDYWKVGFLHSLVK